jgi:hypothetical protein
MRMLKLFFGLLSTMTRAFVLGVAGIVLLTGVVEAAVVKVVSSGGFAAAYRALAPEFEHTTGNILATRWGPSMGNTPDAVPLRIQRGEPIDVVIMVGYALDDLIKQGKVVADSRVDVARSGIGIVVRAGATKPDMSSVAALKRTLLAAKRSRFEPPPVRMGQPGGRIRRPPGDRSGARGRRGFGSAAGAGRRSRGPRPGGTRRPRCHPRPGLTHGTRAARPPRPGGGMYRADPAASGNSPRRRDSLGGPGGRRYPR